jgi:succinate-semialdehyde dehydrogenase / glutarate-semialdehyde dehydrogenase
VKYTESQTIATERMLPVGAPPWIRADRYARVMTLGLKALRRIPGVK